MKLNNLIRGLGKLYEINKNIIKNRKAKYNFIIDNPENLPWQLQNETKCGFVLSTGRCGTKLLTEMLSLEKVFDVWHTMEVELVYPSKLAYKDYYYFNNDYIFPMYERVLLNARYEYVKEAYLKRNIYVETNNRITFYAPYLKYLFPNSRFIHLVRHPGDFVRSGLRRNYYNGMLADEGRITPTEYHAINGRWNQLSNIEKIGWLWNETNSFIEEFKSNIDDSRVLTVRAEELFNDPEVGLKIIKFLGGDTKDYTKKIEKVIKRPINKQKTGNVPKYSNWSEKEKDALRNMVPLSNKYGYSL